MKKKYICPILDLTEFVADDTVLTVSGEAQGYIGDPTNDGEDHRQNQGISGGYGDGLSKQSTNSWGSWDEE